MSGFVVPKFTSNGTGPLPIGIDALVAHLDQMEEDSSVVPNADLFNNVEIQLSEPTSTVLLPTLLPRLISLLSRSIHDPTHAASLLERLLRPVPFETVLSLAPPSTLVELLSSSFAPMNHLGLALVFKAASDARTAAMLARDDMSHVLNALLKLWMQVPDAEVGNGAGKTILALLERDSQTLARVKWGDPVNGAARNSLPRLVCYEGQQGTGHLWSRLFASTPTPLIVRHMQPLLWRRSRQTSLAQDRLMRVLPQLAALSLPHLTRRFDIGLDSPSPPPTRVSMSVLEMSAKSVNTRDLLLVSLLGDFFENLVCLLRLSPWANHGSMAQVYVLVREARERIRPVREALASVPLRVAPEERDAVKAWIDLF